MIIETKLSIPETKGTLINRPHLFQRLHDGLNHRLTLLTAPAGYGKSTLLSEWSKNVQTAVAWVSLDSDDNNPFHFWSHTIKSLSVISPNFNDQFLLRYTGVDASGNELIATLINCANRLSQKVVLIWDDFHTIKDPSILSNVSYLLERLPDNFHLYIASRNQIDLSLSRLRIEGLLNELHVHDLRFSIDETEDLLINCTDLSLKKKDLKDIHIRTEGWATGIRIAALSLNNNELKRKVTTKLIVSGKQRNVTDYFLDEVFMKQPKEIQLFLLKTSILEKMNASLTEALTTTPNGVKMIRQLEKANLFLVSLDEEREWYRYHHLFQDFLRMHLQLRLPEHVQSLHLAAGKWLEKNKMMNQALHHYIMGENYEEALTLLQALLPTLPANERMRAHKWLNKIPDRLLFTRPTLFLINTAALFLSGYAEEATKKYWWAIYELEKAENILTEEKIREFQAGLDFLVAFRSFLEKDFESFITYSRNYLTNQPNGNLLIGFGSKLDGYHPAWDIYISASNLAKAEPILQELLEMWGETENKPFYAHLCIDYGKLLYEQNRLEEAKSYMLQALVIGQTYHNKSLTVTSSLMIAQIDSITNHPELFHKRIKQLLLEVNSQKHPVLFKSIEVLQIEFNLRYQETDSLFTWMENCSLCSTDEISPIWMNEYYLFARALAMQGHTTEALDLIERLLFLATEENKEQEIISLHLFKSILFAEQEQIIKCFKALEEAIVIAENHYLRTFLDIGYELKQILSDYIYAVQHHHYPYENKILFQRAKLIFEQIIHEEVIYSDVMIEEKTIKHTNFLTEREKTVLHHMNQGYSNKIIADELNVSISTVKTHINNIYRKLGVSNRILALQKAKKMKLL